VGATTQPVETTSPSERRLWVSMRIVAEVHQSLKGVLADSHSAKTPFLLSMYGVPSSMVEQAPGDGVM
jgi:hypothetical protein